MAREGSRCIIAAGGRGIREEGKWRREKGEKAKGRKQK
jgi:hypothetical protein